MAYVPKYNWPKLIDLATIEDDTFGPLIRKKEGYGRILLCWNKNLSSSGNCLVGFESTTYFLRRWRVAYVFPWKAVCPFAGIVRCPVLLILWYPELHHNTAALIWQRSRDSNVPLYKRRCKTVAFLKHDARASELTAQHLITLRPNKALHGSVSRTTVIPWSGSPFESCLSRLRALVSR